MSAGVVRRVLMLLLAVLLVLVWQGSLDSPFVYDDKIEVVGNATLRDLDEWRAIATYNVSRPLLVLSYALDFARNGLQPRGYHLSNLLVAGLAAWWAFLLAESLLRLARISQPMLRAGLVAAIWVAHPMGVEAVVYITGRSESLCALFSFFSLWAWAEALRLEREGERGTPWRAASLLAFLGAVSSKEVGAMVPAAALAMELLFATGGLGARLRSVRWAWMVPTAALIGLAAWLRLQHAASFLPKEVDRPLLVQLLTQSESWLHYLRLWLLPWGQTIFHHLPDADPAGLRAWLALGGWVAVVLAGLAWGRKVPLAGLALLCGALFLLPSSSFVALKENMAEHRAYQTGFWLLLAIGATVPERWGRAALGLGVAAILGLGGLSQLRHRAWSSEVALWQEAVDRGPEVAQAWYGLADAHRFAADFDRAIEAYRRALELEPSYLDAWTNLGIAQASLGDVGGARESFRSALRESPTYCKAHANLGVLAAGQKDWDEAMVAFRTAALYCPDNARAHLGLCELYRGPIRDRERAIFHCEAYLVLAPTSEQSQQVKEWVLELTF